MTPDERRVAALTLASHLRNARDRLADYDDAVDAGRRTAASHLFYAAEAVVLAVLLSEGQSLPRGLQHQLDPAVALVPAANPIKPLLLSFTDLTQYATTFRYPTPGGRLRSVHSDKLAQPAVAVRAAFAQAVAGFGVDCAEGADSPARSIGPLRPGKER